MNKYLNERLPNLKPSEDDRSRDLENINKGYYDAYNLGYERAIKDVRRVQNEEPQETDFKDAKNRSIDIVNAMINQPSSISHCFLSYKDLCLLALGNEQGEVARYTKLWRFPSVARLGSKFLGLTDFYVCGKRIWVVEENNSMRLKY